MMPKFEQWWKDQESGAPSMVFDSEEAMARAAYEQGKRDAVPEGWVAIPIIPTDKQIRAMEDQWMRGSNMDMAMREYRSAIAAAPKQEK